MNTSQTVVITGASSGIGLACVKAFAELGHNVVMIARHAADLHELDLAKFADQLIVEVADVRDEDSLRDVQGRMVSRFGHASVLVNSAGIAPKNNRGLPNTLLESTVSEWVDVMDVNVLSIVRTCRVFVPAMQVSGFGRVINIGSLAGRTRSSVASASYMASKAAVLGLTRALASEVAKCGVTANCVAPGRIETPMTSSVDNGLNARYTQTTPSGRLGQAAEIASAVTFLASTDAAYINGAILDINGGAYMP